PHAVEKHRVERGEGPEQVGAEASQDVRDWKAGRLAGARDQREQLVFRVASKGAVCPDLDPAGSGGELRRHETHRGGEQKALHIRSCVTVRLSASPSSRPWPVPGAGCDDHPRCGHAPTVSRSNRAPRKLPHSWTAPEFTR